MVQIGGNFYNNILSKLGMGKTESSESSDAAEFGNTTGYTQRSSATGRFDKTLTPQQKLEAKQEADRKQVYELKENAYSSVEYMKMRQAESKLEELNSASDGNEFGSETFANAREEFENAVKVWENSKAYKNYLEAKEMYESKYGTKLV